MQVAPDVEVAGQYLGEGRRALKWAGGRGRVGLTAESSSLFSLGSCSQRPPNPLSHLLPAQAGALYIVPMLLLSCLADGQSAAAADRFASDSPDSLARDQVQGAQRKREWLYWQKHMAY